MFYLPIGENEIGMKLINYLIVCITVLLIFTVSAESIDKILINPGENAYQKIFVMNKN